MSGGLVAIGHRMDLNRYKELPDALKAAELEEEFEQLLSQADQPGVWRCAAAQAFWELADRQWHTYEMLRPDLRQRVENWFQRHWSSEPEFIEWVGGVAAQLGLAGLLPLLERAAHDFSNVPLGREIEATLREIGSHIDDPYWEMRRKN